MHTEPPAPDISPPSHEYPNRHWHDRFIGITPTCNGLWLRTQFSYGLLRILVPDLKLRVKWSAYKRYHFNLHPFLPCYLGIIQEKRKALGSSSFNIKICTPRAIQVFLCPKTLFNVYKGWQGLQGVLCPETLQGIICPFQYPFVYKIFV